VTTRVVAIANSKDCRKRLRTEPKRSAKTGVVSKPPRKEKDKAKFGTKKPGKSVPKPSPKAAVPTLKPSLSHLLLSQQPCDMTHDRARRKRKLTRRPRKCRKPQTRTQKDPSDLDEPLGPVRSRRFMPRPRRAPLARLRHKRALGAAV
jgi:hypothetical protein